MVEIVILPPSEIKSVIDKTAVFVARSANPSQFEDKLRERQRSDPNFSFLDPANTYHGYYRHKKGIWGDDALEMKDEENKGEEELAASGDSPKPISYIPLGHPTATAKLIQSMAEILPPPEIKSVIDQTALFVARSANPTQFEDKIREGQRSDSKFSFLDPADEYHGYYRHKKGVWGDDDALPVEMKDEKVKGELELGELAASGDSSKPISNSYIPEAHHTISESTPTTAAAKLIQLKGIADIFVALILTVNPQFIYDSPVTHTLSGLSGLHMSNATTARGFNQSIACMVAAVGVGHLVAARAAGRERGVRCVIFAMNLTWSLLGFLTCAQPVEKGVGSATLLMSSISHAVFSLVFLYLDGGDMFGSETRNGNGKRD